MVHSEKQILISLILASQTVCSRGAIECINAIGRGNPEETLCTKDSQRLMAACDTLRRCASGFTQLNYREQAAKSYEACTSGLR